MYFMYIGSNTEQREYYAFKEWNDPYGVGYETMGFIVVHRIIEWRYGDPGSAVGCSPYFWFSCIMYNTITFKIKVKVNPTKKATKKPTRNTNQHRHENEPFNPLLDESRDNNAQVQ